MRSLVLALASLPYGWYALKDGAMHLGKRRVREVSLPEHLLHLILVAPLAWMFAGCFRADIQAAAFGLLCFLPAAVADELVFHRKLPEVESDAHAKGHLTLLLFLGVAAILWLDESGVARVLPWR